MAKFKIVTQAAAGTSFGVSGGGYKLEMEGLGTCDAEIIETAASTEAEFIAAAREADALIAKGRPITKTIIDGLQGCKVIALGTIHGYKTEALGLFVQRFRIWGSSDLRRWLPLDVQRPFKSTLITLDVPGTWPSPAFTPARPADFTALLDELLSQLR